MGDYRIELKTIITKNLKVTGLAQEQTVYDREKNLKTNQNYKI